MASIGTTPYPRQGQIPGARLIGVGLVAALILGILVWTGLASQIQSYIPGMKSATPTYQTSTVSPGNLAVTVTATGPISAVNVLPLTFKESGQLADLKVSVGDTVTKGQVLADLDTTDLQSALTQAKANLQIQQAALAKLQAGATQQTIQVAQASVNSAQSTLTDSTAAIATSKNTAAKSVSTAQAGVTSAATSLAADQAAVTTAQDEEAKQLAADQTAIANAQKNLQTVQASVAANVPIMAQAVQKAKDDLFAAQASRDLACSQTKGGQCTSANASVDSAQTALNTANAQIPVGQVSGVQQITTAQSSLDQANATYTNDKAKLDASVVSAQNTVKQAQAAVTSAQTSLGESQAQATATVQSAQTSADSAANALKTAQANYNQTVAPATPQDIASAQAQVANAQAAVDLAQVNLNSAVLTAPFDGTIAAVNGSVGQWMGGGSVAATNGSTASATAIFTLMDMTNLQVISQVNEADISKVQLGNTVTFDVAAFPNKTFTGKVTAIQPVGTTTSNVVNYNVTSSIQNTDKSAQLYPGMTATVTVVTAQANNVLTVPNSALSFAQKSLPAASRGASTAKQNGVVVLTNGQTKVVPVTVGITDGTNTAIDSGLSAGEVVVTGQSTGTTTRAASTGTSTTTSPLSTGGGLGGGRGG